MKFGMGLGGVKVGISSKCFQTTFRSVQR